MKDKILVIDDDRAVRLSVKQVFERENKEVTLADSGTAALQLLDQHTYDLIILDVLMDDMDGFYVVNLIRKKKIYTPVLFLSGQLEEQNKILAISLGGDDYLTKPFGLEMLTTKANALLRRSQQYNSVETKELVCGELRMSLRDFSLSKQGVPIPLTSKETALIKFLLENQNQVFTKEQLYVNVWKNSVVDDNTIMVYIKRLRDKIEDDSKHPKYLKTAWGLGYIFKDISLRL
ncbi:response regulator transcription factor [Clostridium sp. E02]|uniref:response regulator transcription factor n=1 Tax=Clostridium sp. E02 TaxID=2487134 RepID=UPI0013DDD417|nr:response regulator transcription factor [Clostridium sp. E02]